MSAAALNTRVAVVGATTWGTTLGIILARNDVPVTILARTADEAAELNALGEHRRFLPGTPFPQALTVSGDPEETLAPAQLTIIAVPSDRFRHNVQALRTTYPPARWWSVSPRTGVAHRQAHDPGIGGELPPQLHRGICTLSGPNLAKEIVQGKPASTVVAGRDSDRTSYAQEVLMSPSFRVYTSDDVIGVELAGALKNIIALGAGISDGLGLGDNAKSASSPGAGGDDPPGHRGGPLSP